MRMKHLLQGNSSWWCSFHGNEPVLVRFGSILSVHQFLHWSSRIPSVIQFIIFLKYLRVYYVAFCSHGLFSLIYKHLLSLYLRYSCQSSGTGKYLRSMYFNLFAFLLWFILLLIFKFLIWNARFYKF